jgi:methylmalonyl-CoA mutase N-terminal domain/subunit
MGRDSDDPLTEGEVGRCGVAVDTLADAEDLFAGIDLGSVTTSMTINSPAPILLAMYVARRESRAWPGARLGGTLQNDILKEYQAQKEYIFPPRPSMRLVVDVIRFCAAEMPRSTRVGVGLPHPRGRLDGRPGARLHPRQRVRLRRGGPGRRARRRRVRSPLSFFFNAHLDFFEEIAKYRAARRIWARWMANRYGASPPNGRCSCASTPRPPASRSRPSSPR